MMRIAIKAAYLGAGFFGSQRQPGKRTVEGELLSALEKCFPKTPTNASLPSPIQNFQAAGRTDRGVSALCMVFSFDTPASASKPQIETHPIRGQPDLETTTQHSTPSRAPTLNLSQLNHHLPQDVCCYAIAQAPADFNPRHALQRHYRYFLPNLKLNLKQMKFAAKTLEGTHDFSNFSKKSERNPVRTITKIKVTRNYLDLFAESFLWQQVRRMSYWIVLAGAARTVKGISPPGIPLHKATNNPFSPGNPVPPLPPENLLLMDIKYPLKFQTDQKILSGFKQRMVGLAEKKRIEQEIYTSFTTI